MRANNKSVEETAQDWTLPEAAITEALDYYQRFSDLIETDAAEELALSADLTQRQPTVP